MSVLFNMISCCYKPITCETYPKEAAHFSKTLPKETTLVDLLNETSEYAKYLIRSKERKIGEVQREIISALRSERENSARLKVVDFVDQKNLIRVLEIIIPFCELIARRLPSIDQSEREVPPDMKEAIATLCFVGSKYNELPALLKVRSQFISKYGEEYIVNLTKSKLDCCVNKKIIKLLLLPNPTENERNKLLKKIAIKGNFKEWHPGYKSPYRDWYTGDIGDNFPLSDEDMPSTSASPESMSHSSQNILEIVPAGWNKV